MRKIRIIIPIVAAVAVSWSCSVQEEIGGGDARLTKDDIAFALKGNPTRANISSSDVQKEVTASIDLGDGYYLKETVSSIEDMYAGTPETRGIPIYSQNLVAQRSENISVSILKQAGTSPIFGPDNYALLDDSKLIWHKAYNGESPWDKAGSADEDLYFFVFSDPSNNASITSYNATSEANMAVTFSYTSPTTGADQEDVIFTGKAESKNDYYPAHEKTGIPVTFNHALTAVKFNVGNDNTGSTKTVITGVKFTNLKKTGTCTVKPYATGNNPVVSWNNVQTPGTFTQTFDNPTYVPDDRENNPDGTVSFKESTDFTGTSFAGAGSEKNLNAADGSLTFFFIPQTIVGGENGVTLEVTFRVKTPDTPNGKEIKHLIDFGTKFNNVEWKAGELRTYTLMPEDVDVEIFDRMVGLKKDNLHVTNTGNVPEWVRIMVIGNWYDSNGNILVGYKTDGSGGPNDNEMATPWFREDPVYGQYFDESFIGGHPAAGRTDWVRGTGSYFYYTEKIGPGTQLTPDTNPIFQSYELPADKIPTIYIPSENSSTRVAATGVHLVMEVVIQAISTINPETGAEFKDWKEAWSYATGKEIKEKPYEDEDSGDEGGENNG